MPFMIRGRPIAIPKESQFRFIGCFYEVKESILLVEPRFTMPVMGESAHLYSRCSSRRVIPLKYHIRTRTWYRDPQKRSSPKMCPCACMPNAYGPPPETDPLLEICMPKASLTATARRHRAREATANAAGQERGPSFSSCFQFGIISDLVGNDIIKRACMWAFVGGKSQQRL